jgi:hypothetical protein
MDQKLSHAAVHYSRSNGGDCCGGCRFFLAPNSCERVQSPVSAGGWCRLFQKRKVKTMPKRTRIGNFAGDDGQQIARLAREGKLTTRVLKRRAKKSYEVVDGDDVQDNGRIKGAILTGHINANPRAWPKESAVKQSNNLKGWSKQSAPRIRPTGGYYGGGSRNA